MVHTFGCLDRLFALDTESGSAFEIDLLTKLLIDKRIAQGQTANKKENHSPALVAGEFSDFSQQDIIESNKEIDELIQEGVLFSAEENISAPKYSGIIKALCLNISHDCNLRCAYCFADGGSYNTIRQNMSKEIAQKSIDFLIKNSGNRKNLEVDFFGGEPLLNMDTVKHTISYARSIEEKHGKNFRFTITTNGVGLTDDLIDYFNQEMFNVVISIDGREEIHDLTRKDAGGKGTYQKTLKNALRFRQKRGDKLYYVRGTFTARNKDFSNDVLSLNDVGFDQISIEPVVLFDDNPLALKEQDLPFLKEQYEILAREYLSRRKTDKWFNFFHFSFDLDGGPCLKKRLTGCGAGCEYIAVSPDGSIYPCHRFDGKQEYKMGNVLDCNINTAIQSHFAASSLLSKPHCKDCFCKYFCSGGCAANSIEYGGGIDSQYKISCQLMKKRAELAIAISLIELT